MDSVSVGFWGAYFGVAIVAFLAAAIPLSQGLPRVALLMAAGPLLNGAYVVAALGWFPGGTEFNLRVQSGLALHNTLALSALMLLMLRTRGWVWRAWFATVGVVLALGVLVWTMEPRNGMILATGYAVAVTLAALGLLFSPMALRHHRLAWLAVCSVASVSIGLAATAWIAAHAPAVPWQVHALTAIVVAVHEICMGFAVWSQFSHLAELQLIRAYGSGYDPVTRMRSLETAGQLINAVFSARNGGSVGAIVVTVANLYSLENLHGRAEHNQALFILATRLRNTLPRGVQTVRLGPDVFLLLMRRSPSIEHLLEVARRLRDRLARPVTLGSVTGPSEVHLGAHQWAPDLGIGVLDVPPELNRAAAVNTARNMSRTAMSYPSRIACYSEDRKEVVEAMSPGRLSDNAAVDRPSATPAAAAGRAE